MGEAMRFTFYDLLIVCTICFFTIFIRAFLFFLLPLRVSMEQKETKIEERNCDVPSAR